MEGVLIVRQLEETKKWWYFIQLINEDSMHNLVEAAKQFEDGIPVCCSYDYAIRFDTVEEAHEFAKTRCELNEDEYLLISLFCL